MYVDLHLVDGGLMASATVNLLALMQYSTKV